MARLVATCLVLLGLTGGIAEAKVRADYPDDTFDKMLADEFIEHARAHPHGQWLHAVEGGLAVLGKKVVHLQELSALSCELRA